MPTTPKVIVAVIVYDRFDNVKEWIRCWAKSETAGHQLFIIHNYESNESRAAFYQYCMDAGVGYVARQNIGFDIGAFQDVARGRLAGFPYPNSYDYLLWCPDDLMPMRKQFIEEYLNKFGEKVGAVCYEISAEVQLHIRTTGFMLRSKDLAKIEFHTDPITTKWDCYIFEHKSANTLLHQVEAKIGKAVEVADVEHSCMWDMGHRSAKAKARQRRRWMEKGVAYPNAVQQSSDLVTIICPIFKDPCPAIIASMLAQSHKNWKLVLVHDGPEGVGMIKSYVNHFNDARIEFRWTPQHLGVWGHYIRKAEVAALGGEGFVVITNADNYHPPTFLEYMLKGFKANPAAVATYCSDMVHSYKAWQIIPCKLQQGFLDCAGVMVKADVAKAVGWNETEAHSSDWIYFCEIATKHGWENFQKVEGCLLVHN